MATRSIIRKTLLLLVLPALLGVAMACTMTLPRTRHARDPLAPQRVAIRPAYWDILSLPQVRTAPRYELTEEIDLGQRLITGTVHITVTNRIPRAWHTVALRLFPNLRHYGGDMRIRSLRGNDQQLPFRYSESRTAVLADLPMLVESGSTLHLEALYTVHYPRWEPHGYWLFGEHNGVINLPLAYPVLAVPREDGTWKLDDGLPMGDTLTAESSLFHARVSVPATVTLLSSAVISATRPYTPAHRITYELVSGPAREFTLVLGKNYKVVKRNVQGVSIRTYYLPGDEETAQAALTYAAAAWQVYSHRFGFYPYVKMDVVEAMLINRGMEYPLMSQLGVDLFRDERRKLEFLTVHEVGHQWWYNQVGNDQVNEPWLDEGLTEYSTYFYYQDIYGRDTADAVLHNRWEIPVRYIRDRGLDAPIGLPESEYTPQNYETIVYGKGALFFHTMRERLGDEVFLKALRTYLNTYRYRIASGRDLQQVFEDVSGEDLDDLFRTWVYGP